MNRILSSQCPEATSQLTCRVALIELRPGRECSFCIPSIYLFVSGEEKFLFKWRTYLRNTIAFCSLFNFLWFSRMYQGSKMFKRRTYLRIEFWFEFDFLWFSRIYYWSEIFSVFKIVFKYKFVIFHISNFLQIV